MYYVVIHVLGLRLLYYTVDLGLALHLQGHLLRPILHPVEEHNLRVLIRLGHLLHPLIRPYHSMANLGCHLPQPHF